jgi:hypothetical protein
MIAEVTGPVPILRTVKPKLKVDFARAVTAAVRQPGVSGWWLMQRIVRCRLSYQKLTSEEFFRYGLHRPTVSDADCRAFLNDQAMHRLNAFLNGPAEENDTDLLMDKLRTNAVLAAAGLPVARELATYHPETGTLRTAAAIAAFLLDGGNLPLFGKPVHARSTLGVAAVERAVGGGMVELGDGRIVAAASLGAEIAEHYGQGYVFQELLRASAAIRPLSGPVLPTLRMTTLLLGGVPVLLYAAMRLPSPGAMADDGGAGGNVRLHLDEATGAVLRGQNMTRFGGTDVELAPVTKVALKGQSVPDWPAVLRLADAAHRQFPRHPFVGTDIALSDRGLVLNEVNAHPHHMTYQMVSNRGILNDAFRPLFRQALAEKGITTPRRGVAWPYV